MSDRVIDTERAGGTGNAAPKRVQTTAPMSVEDALSYRDSIAWRHFPPRGDRAVVALSAEVDRLRVALPEIIGCPYGDPAPCATDEFGWYPCCKARRAAIRHGLLPRPNPDAEENDGA